MTKARITLASTTLVCVVVLGFFIALVDAIMGIAVFLIELGAL